MSYLIGLYVYYHGNNLGAFGFVKGSQEIQNQNQGMKNIDDLKYDHILPDKDVEILKMQEVVRKENNYEEMMRQAILQAQRESIQLYQKGLIKNDVIDSTPSGVIDDIYNEGNIDLNFFDELNGF